MLHNDRLNSKQSHSYRAPEAPQQQGASAQEQQKTLPTKQPISTFLATMTHNLFTYIQTVINSYQARAEPNASTQILNQQILQQNIAMLQAELSQQGAAELAGIREQAINDTRLALASIHSIKPQYLINEAINNIILMLNQNLLAKNILTAQKYYDLLYEQLLILTLERTIKAQLSKNTALSGLQDNEACTLHVLNMFYKEINDFIAQAAQAQKDLKKMFDALIDEMMIALKTLLIQNKTIDLCLRTGTATLIQTLHLTGQQALMLPQGELKELLERKSQTLLNRYKRKHTVHKKYNMLLNSHEQDVYKIQFEEEDYEEYTQQLQYITALYFDKITMLGLWLQKHTETKHQALTILMQALIIALELLSSKELSAFIDALIEHSQSIDPLINLYQAFVFKGKEVFGPKQWGMLNQKSHDALLHVVFLILIYEKEELNFICIDKKTLLTDFRTIICKNGIQLTEKLAKTNPKDQTCNQLTNMTNILSGSLKIIDILLAKEQYAL